MNKKSEEIYEVYSLDGKKYLGSFNTVKEIAEKFEDKPSNVRYSLNNKTIFNNYQVIIKGDKPRDLKEKASKRAKKIIWYTHEGEFIQEFKSTLDASKKLGIPQSSVSATASKDISYNIKYNLRFEGEEAKNLYEGHQILIFNEYGTQVPKTEEDGSIVFPKYNTFEEAFESVGIKYNKDEFTNGYKKVKDGYQFVREPHLDLVTIQTKYLVDKEPSKEYPKGIKTVKNTLEEVGEFISKHEGLEKALSRERVRQIVATNGQKRLRGFRVVKINKGDK